MSNINSNNTNANNNANIGNVTVNNNNNTSNTMLKFIILLGSYFMDIIFSATGFEGLFLFAGSSLCDIKDEIDNMKNNNENMMSFKGWINIIMLLIAIAGTVAGFVIRFNAVSVPFAVTVAVKCIAAVFPMKALIDFVSGLLS